MNSYIQPNKNDQQLMDAVAIPVGSHRRVRDTFTAMVHKKTPKRVIGISALVFSGALAAFAFMIVTQSNSSFITQALAASRAKVAMMQDGDVRHIVTVTSPDMLSSMHYDNIRDSSMTDEWWLSSDEKSYSVSFHRDNVYAERMLFLNGEAYVAPEKYNLYYAEMQSASTEKEDADVQTDSQGDERSLALNEGSALEMRIQNLLGFGVQRNVVPNITGAIEELATSSLVKDLGEQKREDLGKVHVYSLSYLDDRFDTPDVIIQGIDYVFDAKTKELMEIGHWTQSNDEARQESSIIKIVTNEVVSLKSLAINPFDPAAQGLVAMAGDGTSDNHITSSALMANPYEVKNFRCEGNCQNLVVMGNSAPLFSDPTCVTCNEILLWANLNGDGDAIVLGEEASIQGEFASLPTQDLPLSQYPDWVGRTFPLGIAGTDTVLNVTLQQTGEWNLIADVNCVSGCENIKVGVQRDTNELLIDTCPPKPCNMFSIVADSIMVEDNPAPADGVWVEDDNWTTDGYMVSVWRIPSIFAFNDDHGEEITRVDYSPDQTKNGQTLHFDQTVDGHAIAFDLISTLP